jgi:hypothetical protein
MLIWKHKKMERKRYNFPKKSNFHSWVIDVMFKITSMFSPKIFFMFLLIESIYVQIYAFLKPNFAILGQVLFLEMTTCEMK